MNRMLECELELKIKDNVLQNEDCELILFYESVLSGNLFACQSAAVRHLQDSCH
jgi:hypothetical protein